MIRPFDWRDFPRLHRYRKRGAWLNNELALTQWQIQVPLGALFAYMAPAVGVYTFVAVENGSNNGSVPEEAQPVIGQILHQIGNAYARLAFLAPEEALGSSNTLHMLDHLAAECGKWGAQNLLAEVDELSPLFDTLRQAGFGVFSRQKVWRLPAVAQVKAEPTNWRPVSEDDESLVRGLYNAIVPPLVQQTEIAPWQPLNGFIYQEGNDLQAYVHLAAGPRGIIAQPYIHPDLEQVTGRLAALFNNLPYRGDRPLYLIVRSYQGWLDAMMMELQAEVGPGQALMAKRLTIAQKIDLSLKLPAGIISQSGIEGVQPKSTYSRIPVQFYRDAGSQDLPVCL